MTLLGNLIWLIFGGLVSALAFYIIGALLCITVIGIPFGLQCFKLGKLCLSPFGKKVTIHPGSHPVANALWVIFFGWELALIVLLASLVLAITIIGIPFAKQLLKFSKLFLLPFGAEVF